MTEPSFQHRRAGLVWGSFVAESLSLGVHWIYDTHELSQKFGYVTDYHAPGADSYHPKKQAGDQGHVGDQALCLVEFLNRDKQWDAEAFMVHWSAMWPGYPDYLDKATKTVLANIGNGQPPTAAASASDELAGPARMAPLVAFLADKPETEVVQAAVEQTGLTHRSPEAEEAATFLATAAYRLMQGNALEATMRDLAPEWALAKAEKVLSLSAIEAIGQLGQSCPIKAALPAVIYLVLKHGDDCAKAFSENAMAGGDNCARALVLGMLLGAAHGADAIPQAWCDGLLAKASLSELIG